MTAFFVSIFGGFGVVLGHLFKPVFKPKTCMNTSISVVLYKLKQLSNGTFPLMIRLTKNRKLKYINLKVSLSPEHWDTEKCKPKRNCPNRAQVEKLIRHKVEELQNQVMAFKADEKEYTLHTLIDKTSKSTSRATVGEYLNSYIEKLQSANRIGNADTFIHLRTALTKCFGCLDFYFGELDISRLKDLENWFRQTAHLSANSIGIRFRSLRALYNQAIEDGIVKQDSYPFDSFKVSQFNEDTAKRALTKEQIHLIIELDVRLRTKYPTPFMQLSKDLFLFSYLGCGINLTDMLHLRYRDVFDGRVTYHRQKTGKLISFYLQPMAMDILRKYYQEEHSPDDYIFPVLKRNVHITATQQYSRVKRVTRRINRYLKVIGEHLNLPIPITTYVARHSYATVLKRSGVSTSIISESLGHSSEKITQIYLDSFENSQIDETMKNLL